MSKKDGAIDAANKVTAYASCSILLAAFAVDRLKPFGVEFNTDLPVLNQFVEHAGNLVVSGMLAYGVIFAANKVEKKAGNLTTVQRVLGAGAMGLAVGAGFNAIPDTQAGMDHVGKYIYQCENPNPAENGPYCTVDPDDFVWGTLGTGVIAMSMTQWRKPHLNR